MADTTINTEAQKFYAERVEFYLKSGDTLQMANEKADLDLVEWSQPLPLPEMDIEELWS